MAKLLILTDRSPHDTDWKGALSWQIILSLAEAHHEVLVATPLDLDEIGITHPRLQVTRPVRSWGAGQLPKLAKLLLTYRPRIIHTFALRPSSQPGVLTLWPYLHAVCEAAGVSRYATLFEAGDLNDSIWLEGSQAITVFDRKQKETLKESLRGKGEILPLEIRLPAADGDSAPVSNTALIPAPVSEWAEAEKGLLHLAEYLRAQSQRTVRIVGGFGDWPASKRRAAWMRLESVAGRVALTEPLGLEKFVEEVQGCETVWLQPLDKHSWKFLLSSQVALQLGKKIFISTPLEFELPSGSTANSLSRLYFAAKPLYL